MEFVELFGGPFDGEVIWQERLLEHIARPIGLEAGFTSAPAKMSIEEAVKRPSICEYRFCRQTGNYVLWGYR